MPGSPTRRSPPGATDEVVVDAVLRGTGPDGAVLAHEYRVVYTLRDGQIVRALARYDPAPLAELNREAFQSLGEQPRD